jgi:hypothetical protein
MKELLWDFRVATACKNFKENFYKKTKIKTPAEFSWINGRFIRHKDLPYNSIRQIIMNL